MSFLKDWKRHSSFAKRQMTYFRGMERRGVKINWLSAKNGIQENVKIIIEQWNRH
jgi:tRNA dimethylallyltransferase